MKSFSSSKLHPQIIRVLDDKGIIVPSEIQAKTIPLLLDHEGDFVGRSATGTGKTFAFGAPLLSKIDANSGVIQAVVLVPTRELCEQVGNELIGLGKFIDGLKIESIYGGVSLKSQIHELSNGVQVIVATPGRLMDLVKRKVVHLSGLKYLIFDEADEMLLKGFQTDIDGILESSSRSYSTWLFSATMPQDLSAIVNKYLKKSLKKVLIGEDDKTNSGIEHLAIELEPEDKLTVLLHYLARFEDKRGVIFCRTKSGVQKLYKQLSANKFSCGALHGSLPQGLRSKVIDQYKEGHINILIATDVASRGMDVDDLSFVIQYHLPDTKEAYTHRSGRTSRAGKSGISLTFIFPEESKQLDMYDRKLRLNLNYLSLPNEKDQLINKAILWGRKIAKTKPISKDNLDGASRQDFFNTVNHLSKEELLEKMLATYLREQQKN